MMSDSRGVEPQGHEIGGHGLEGGEIELVDPGARGVVAEDLLDHRGMVEQPPVDRIVLALLVGALLSGHGASLPETNRQESEGEDLRIEIEELELQVVVTKDVEVGGKVEAEVKLWLSSGGKASAQGGLAEGSNQLAWFQRFGEWSLLHLWHHPRLRADLEQAAEVHRWRHPDNERPTGVTPEMLRGEGAKTAALRRQAIVQRADGLAQG